MQKRGFALTIPCLTNGHKVTTLIEIISTTTKRKMSQKILELWNKVKAFFALTKTVWIEIKSRCFDSVNSDDQNEQYFLNPYIPYIGYHIFVRNYSINSYETYK